MSWTESPTGAMKVDTGATRYDVALASISTVFVSSEDRLRMFGVAASDLDPGDEGLTYSSSAFDERASVPAASRASDHVTYVQSEASGGYDFTFSGDGSETVYLTVIPTFRQEIELWYSSMTWYADGSSTVDVQQTTFSLFYKDCALVRIPIEHGGGWLMLMTRCRKPDWDGEDARSSNSPGSCTSDIVCYHTEESEPTFATSDVIGPFWLVDSLNAIHDDLEAAGIRIRAWLSVPGGIVRVDEADGEAWLYVYYTCVASGARPFGTDKESTFYGAETSETYGLDVGEEGWNAAREAALDYDPQAAALGLDAFSGGVMVKRIRVSQLMDWIAAGTANTDEATWETDAAAAIVPGELLGQIRVYEEEPDAGGAPVYLAMRDLSFADPSPLECEDSVFSVFLAVHSYDEAFGMASGEEGTTQYGIWKARALPTKGDTVQGRDYVMTDPDDLVVGARPEDTEPLDTARTQTCVYYSDPDTVSTPDGAYRTYTTRTQKTLDETGRTESADLDGLRRFDGDHDDACGVSSSGPPTLDAPSPVTSGELPDLIEDDERPRAPLDTERSPLPASVKREIRAKADRFLPPWLREDGGLLDLVDPSTPTFVDEDRLRSVDLGYLRWVGLH
jgi:hypothetical protein